MFPARNRGGGKKAKNGRKLTPSAPGHYHGVVLVRASAQLAALPIEFVPPAGRGRERARECETKSPGRRRDETTGLLSAAAGRN